MDLNRSVKEIINKLESGGFEAYLVGGAVRDYLLGIEPIDYDICTNANIEEVRKTFSNYQMYLTSKSKKTVTVIVNEMHIEVSSFKGSTIEEDLSKRDFTINAIAYNNKYIDISNGIIDLENRVLKVVDGASTIKNDPIRILRAIRLANKLKLSIIHETQVLINLHCNMLSLVAKERIKSEFCKIILLDDFLKVITSYLDVFTLLIPNLNLISKNKININCNIKNDVNFRIALVFCIICDGLNIDECMIICNDFLNTYKFSNKEKKLVRTLVHNHRDIINPNKESVKKYLSRNNIDFINLLEIKKCLTMLNIIGDETINELVKIYKTIIDNHESYSVTMLDINGADVFNAGYVGFEIGKVLLHVLDLVIEGKLSNNRDDLLKYIKTAKMLL